MDNEENVVMGCIGVIFILFLCAIPFVSYNTTRAGQHNGYVTAVEQGGIFFHNYRIYFKTDNQSSQEDMYCVQEADKTLADKLKEANAKKAPVTIKYDGVRGVGLGLCRLDKIVDVVFE